MPAKRKGKTTQGGKGWGSFVSGLKNVINGANNFLKDTKLISTAAGIAGSIAPAFGLEVKLLVLVLMLLED